MHAHPIVPAAIRLRRAGFSAAAFFLLILAAAPPPALATTPDWSAAGTQEDEYFGSRLTTAGDVNGDGYSDVIVGGYGWDPMFGQDEGRAYVFHGSPFGLASTPAWTFENGALGSFLGIGVACAGDVNGDGFDDVIVGASRYDDQKGRAYLFLGSSAGLAANPVWVRGGTQDSEYFGWDVEGAGDVNGDGYDDVIIGALLYDAASANEGRAYVFHGSAAGLEGTPTWIVDGTDPNGQLGTSVDSAGDVNADGYDDVIVGAYVDGASDAGRAFVYHGGPAGLLTTPAWNVAGPGAGAWFGYSVSRAGDMNGDGYSDVVVGAPQDGAGKVFVYHGSPTGLSMAAAWTSSNWNGPEVGWCVGTAGDRDGDGYADIVIGVPGADHAIVAHGAATGLAGFYSFVGQQLGARFGHCVSTAGDVNGDGFSDLLVGSQVHDGSFADEGRGSLFLGKGRAPNYVDAWAAQGSVGDRFGQAVSSAGDVNGDGLSDVIVGVPDYDSGEEQEGRAIVYLGTPGGVSAVSSWSVESNQVDARLGYAVASAGDVNGDGYSDVIVGAVTYPETLEGEGAAFLYLGSASGLASTPAWSAFGGQEFAQFGGSVAGAGDVNGDGYSDVIVGAAGYSNGETVEGGAFVYLGSPSGLSASADWVAESNQALARFGHSVASAGDVNGDGYSDVIVGAIHWDESVANGGGAFVYHGSAGGLGALPAWSATSGLSDSWFGYSVAGAGDVNGDGYSDVVVGAPLHSFDEDGEGAAFVYHGSAAGLSSTVSWSYLMDAVDSWFGYSVSSAGDVNGDGYSDLLVGAVYFTGYPFVDPYEGGAFLYFGSAASLGTQPAWTAVGGDDEVLLGASVGSAGDVNGDGFSDVIVGGPHTVGSGVARVHLGGQQDGPSRDLRQLRVDASAPIALLGRSDATDGFRVTTRGMSPAGRADVRLELEVKPAGMPFTGAGTTITNAFDSGVTGHAFDELITGLQSDSPYRWRVRILADAPHFPRSRWMSVAGNGMTEYDLRTGGAATDVPVILAAAAGSPLEFAPPRPNPSAGPAALSFTLPAAGNTRLAVYDLAGRRVVLLADGLHTAGAHTFRWDGTNSHGRRVASGTYFARLSFGGLTETRKIVRVR